MSKKSVFNRTNSNIDWAKYSWNPVTGCLNGCNYCYARDIAKRFNPQGFHPYLWLDRLQAPFNMPKPKGHSITDRSVFVCSMADLFGPWIPESCIQAVLEPVSKTPWFTYIFLTKFPERLPEIHFPSNCWVGATVDTQARVQRTQQALEMVRAPVRFISLEPFQEPILFYDLSMLDWLIIGGRSRTSRCPEFQPKLAWVKAVLAVADCYNIPIYMKPNLRVEGLSKRTEFPTEFRRENCDFEEFLSYQADISAAIHDGGALQNLRGAS